MIMSPSDIPVPQKGFFVAHFLTVKDQTKSKEFYVGVLGGKIVKEENPCYIKLQNSWQLRRRSDAGQARCMARATT
jgi:hypothetical protein